MSTAKERGLIDDMIFSLCFSKHGGYLTIGGVDTTFHNKGEVIKYIPYTGNTQYKVPFESYQFGTETVSRTVDKSYYSVIDSGTTLTYFPKKIYSEFETYFSNYCKSNDCKSTVKGVCFTPKQGYNWDSLYETLPKVYFHLKDKGDKIVKVTWTARDYLIVSETNPRDLCVGITKWGYYLNDIVQMRSY